MIFMDLMQENGEILRLERLLDSPLPCSYTPGFISDEQPCAAKATKPGVLLFAAWKPQTEHRPIGGRHAETPLSDVEDFPQEATSLSL